MTDSSITSEALEADYLIIGTGAMGMAFADALMTESSATIVMVDRHARPGGHWNDSYPHVRLHQPSRFYGVNSRQLGEDTIDQIGWNAGLLELASGTEVVTYFEQVMQQQFLPSGRVQYFPMSNYEGDGEFTSLVSGERRRVNAAKVVDATYMNVMVPSIAGPTYDVGDGVRCVPPNDLGRLASPADDYVVVGGGKTAIDACLWLLSNGVDPDKIRWIRPRDAWLLDRANIQAGEPFVTQTLLWAARQVEIAAAAESIDDLFAAMEAEGQLLRIDTDVQPTMYRCATVTTAELDQLRRIDNVIRLGRVVRIERDQIVLDDGNVPTSPDTLHVDCSSDGLATRPIVPVFAGDKITLQSIRSCQQVFSAALLGHLEATGDDDEAKNAMATVVPHPDTDVDWLRVTLATNLNTGRWRADPAIAEWLSTARLDAFSRTRSLDELPDEQLQLVMRVVESAGPAVMKLQELLADLDG